MLQNSLTWPAHFVKYNFIFNHLQMREAFLDLGNSFAILDSSLLYLQGGLMWFEISMSSLITVMFITTVFFVNKAFKELPVGSPLRYYAESHITILLLLMLYSVWHTLNRAFQWTDIIGPFMIYPEYILMSLAVVMILFSSFRLYRIYQKAKQMGLTIHE
jgi:hypothetical protein